MPLPRRCSTSCAVMSTTCVSPILGLVVLEQRLWAVDIAAIVALIVLRQHYATCSKRCCTLHRHYYLWFIRVCH
jgi:hypothetical protein